MEPEFLKALAMIQSTIRYHLSLSYILVPANKIKNLLFEAVHARGMKVFPSDHEKINTNFRKHKEAPH